MFVRSHHLMLRRPRRRSRDLETHDAAIRSFGAFELGSFLMARMPTLDCVAARIGHSTRTGSEELVQFVDARRAAALSGLSADQLREWTTRRGLIPADVRSRGRGLSAQFAWETILLLRIAATLRGTFRMELQTRQELFARLRRALGATPFSTLWGNRLAIYRTDGWAFLGARDHLARDEDLILIGLNPHLQVLAAGFSLPRPDLNRQLDLFATRPPALALPAGTAVRDFTGHADEEGTP